MAQKKLLFSLILSLFFSLDTTAKERFDLKKEDLEFAKDLTEKSKQMTLSGIKAKWLELQNMLRSQNRNNMGDTESLAAFNREREWGTSFRIFVSSSMSKNLLKSYAKQAKKYNAVLVFNGLPEGSWRKLSELITEISGTRQEDIAAQIDNEAFARFNVSRVPSFVLSKEEDIFSENPKVTFDKVSGSIGIGAALEIFASKGELKDIANIILKGEATE
jgi:type-F conjugative transfer system pilin assembly protein TrbC